MLYLDPECCFRLDQGYKFYQRPQGLFISHIKFSFLDTKHSFVSKNSVLVNPEMRDVEVYGEEYLISLVSGIVLYSLNYRSLKNTNYLWCQSRRKEDLQSSFSY